MTDSLGLRLLRVRKVMLATARAMKIGMRSTHTPKSGVLLWGESTLAMIKDGVEVKEEVWREVEVEDRVEVKEEELE
jgi:hypothetical protein